MLDFEDMKQRFIDLLLPTEGQNLQSIYLRRDTIIIQHLKDNLKVIIDYKNSISLDKSDCFFLKHKMFKLDCEDMKGLYLDCILVGIVGEEYLD